MAYAKTIIHLRVGVYSALNDSNYYTPIVKVIYQQRESEIIRYRPANNEKNNVRHHVKMRHLDMPNNLKQYINYNITITLALGNCSVQRFNNKVLHHF